MKTLCFAFIAVIGILCALPINAQYDQLALENDLEVLNYALSLEKLESTFHAQMLQRFTAQDFMNENFSSQAYNYLVIIGAHEMAHATLIEQTIVALNGEVAPNCTYDFSMVNNVTMYLLTTQLLENTGTSAYAGALNRLTLAGLQQAAATIMTVEARQATFLNYILGDVPFPEAFDPALYPDQVAAIAASLIVSCPNNFTIPQPTVRPFGVSGNQTSSINDPTIMYTQAQIENDVATLQYALTLEHLEKNFYVQFQGQFSSSDFTNANLSASDYVYFDLIRDHEIAHVQFLNDSLTALGIVPVAACTYDFSMVVDVASYITLAKVFENTGVSAYDGVANAITDIYYQEAAATIAAIEARHASYINTLVPNATSPFPNTVDPVLYPAMVAELIRPFIVNCPQFLNLVAPTVAPIPNNLNGIIDTDGSIIPSGVVGDPQFVGLRGQSYQIHGIDGEVYNLITSSNLQVNARFVYLDTGKCMKDIKGHHPIACWSHPGSYLGEIAVKLVIDNKLHRLLLSSGSIDQGFQTVEIDGISMNVGEEIALSGATESLSITYSHTHYVTVNTRLFSFGFDNSDMFINQRVRTNVGFNELRELDTHGLFGQSWRGGARKGPMRKIKEIEGDVDEYSIVDGDIFGDDFIYNRYHN